MEARLANDDGTIAFFERYAYDAVGNMTARYGMGGDITTAPDADDQVGRFTRHATATLVGQAEADATVTVPLHPQIDVEHDAHGNWIAPRVPITPTGTGAVNVQLKAEKPGESNAYRLATFSVNQLDVDLVYDADGNLLTHNTPLRRTYNPDVHRAAQNLAYDAYGRLAEAETEQAEEQYFYDASGRRIAKVINGTPVLYLWEGMEILATADANADLVEYYTRGIGLAGDIGTLLAVHHFATAETVFLHSNHRGDIVLATDASGTAIGQYEYTPFGHVLSTTGTYVPRFGFSSKERDATGLVYYGFRFYSPDLCRWITPDRIHEEGGINLYQFCRNNPLIFIDSYGKAAIMVWIIVIVVGVGGTIMWRKFAKWVDESFEDRPPLIDPGNVEEALERQRQMQEEVERIRGIARKGARIPYEGLNPIPDPRDLIPCPPSDD